MARYGIRYVTFAAEQRDALPSAARRAYDIVINTIAEDPRGHGRRNSDTGSWYAEFGDRHEGVVNYVIGDNIITVTVIRITWAG